MKSKVEALKASDVVRLLNMAIKQYGDLPVFAQAGEGEDSGGRFRRGPVFCVVNGDLAGPEGSSACIDILAYHSSPKWMEQIQESSKT
jgi:hypothetical protein